MKTQSLLLFAWLLLSPPVAVQAQFTYTTNIYGTVTITGYSGTNSDVVIPSTLDGLPVVNIGANAFGWTSIAKVLISDSVTNIGDYAFFSCFSLTNVTIGNSVSAIGSYAFSGGRLEGGGENPVGCPLASITIPNSVTSIGGYAFLWCRNLTSVTIGNGVTAIEPEAFLYCRSLTNVTIGNNVRSIGAATFEGCTALTSVTIPNSVTNIGDDAFETCLSLTNLTLGTGLRSIGVAAFAECSSLTNVYFMGNAPDAGGLDPFSGDKAIAYYLPGATGWSTNYYGGIPTALWTLPYPLILNNSPGFGVQTNGFGFTVSWATNLNVIVEASADLGNPAWSPVATNALSGGTFYFSDPQWTKYPSRFYRVRSQ